MEVMCEQLQNILRTFLQLQTAEKETAERTDLDSSGKATNLIGFSGITYQLKTFKNTFKFCDAIKEDGIYVYTVYFK